MRGVLSAAAMAARVAAATASTGAATGASPGWPVVITPSLTGATASSLAGVACSGAGPCTAVGQFQTHAGVFVLAERWNGTAWSIQTSPEPTGAADAFLKGVSCPTATACTAAGNFSTSTSTNLTLAQHWDGTTWSPPELTGCDASAEPPGRVTRSPG
jgi:hypothetical protein